MAANHRRANYTSLEEAGLTPLSLLFADLSQEKVDEVREALERLSTTALIHHFLTATVKGNRIAAFMLAMELTNRGIAPFFRRSDLGGPERARYVSVNQEYDWLVHDLLWLAKEVPDSVLAGVLITWEIRSWDKLLKRADSLFWFGNRPIWLIVKKLKLSERAQWECLLLKSLPIKRKALGLNQSAQRIYDRLIENLPAIMRTGTDEISARRILSKRKRLWYCAEMCNWSPTETARLYRRMTGEAVTKSYVANQLSKIAKYRRRQPNLVETEAYE